MAQIHVLGCSPAVERSIVGLLGRSSTSLPPESPHDGDCVLLSPSARDVPTGNAFTACRQWKRVSTRIRVFFVVGEDDVVTEEVARFCLADGVVRVDEAGSILDPNVLTEALDPERRGVSVDALLARLQARMAGSDQAAAEVTVLQRMVSEFASGQFLDVLTDPETGLFDGPFAAFKLDEEFKRAMRFHQPLSLILLDCGAMLPDDLEDRRIVLAEIASVFLNECRDIDTLARFTESVFLFLLPGTGADGAAAVARRVLDGLRTREFFGGLRADPAAGITTVPQTGITDRNGFLARAESCLAMARTDGSFARLCAL